VDPQLHDLVRCLKLSRLGDQQSLKYTRYVSQVKFVVEIQRGFPESHADGLVQSQSRFNQTGHLFLNLRLEVF